MLLLQELLAKQPILVLQVVQVILEAEVQLRLHLQVAAAEAATKNKILL
jgi:hypothetical protein